MRSSGADGATRSIRPNPPKMPESLIFGASTIPVRKSTAGGVRVRARRGGLPRAAHSVRLVRASVPRGKHGIFSGDYAAALAEPCRTLRLVRKQSGRAGRRMGRRQHCFPSEFCPRVARARPRGDGCRGGLRKRACGRCSAPVRRARQIGRPAGKTGSVGINIQILTVCFKQGDAKRDRNSLRKLMVAAKIGAKPA